MSFFPHEGDNFMIHEALALIDPSDDNYRNSATFPPLDEIDELLGSVIEVLPEEATVKAENPTTKKKTTTTKSTTTKPRTRKKTAGEKKRVRSPNSSSTVLQRRKKAEILSLREQAAELQTVLKQLLSSNANSPILNLNAKAYAKVQDEKLSRWHRCAIKQYELRQNSLNLNRQLKKSLSQQRNMYGSLRGVLQRQSVVEDMNYMKKFEVPAPLHRPLAGDDVCRSMAQLEREVDKMYSEYQNPNSMFGSALSVSSHVKTSYKEQRKGDVVELITITTMNCSMADASKVVWSHFEKDQTLESKPNVLHDLVTLTVEHLEDTLHFEKLHYLRKFSEPEKISMVYSAIMLLRSKGLIFFANGLTTIMPLPADPLHTCVVHTVFKIHGNSEAGGGSPLEKDTALGALSKALRLFWQAEQSRLIDESDRISGETINSFIML